MPILILVNQSADVPDRRFSIRNVLRIKALYLAWPILPTASAESAPAGIASCFPVSWSAYEDRQRPSIKCLYLMAGGCHDEGQAGRAALPGFVADRFEQPVLQGDL